MAMTRSRANSVKFNPVQGNWGRLPEVIEKINSNILVTPIHVDIPIPVCVGFDGVITPEQLDDVLTKCEAQSTSDCIYRCHLYLAPRPKLPDESEEPIDAWYKNNQAVLDKHPDVQVSLMSVWRSGSVWQEAKKKLDAVLSAPEQKDSKGRPIKSMIDRLLDLDTKGFLERHPTLRVSDAAIKQHILEDAIDCLSWMVKSDDKLGNRVSAFVYQYTCAKTVEYVFKAIPGDMGYQPDSLIHLKKLIKPAVQDVAEVPVEEHIVASDPGKGDFYREVARELLRSGMDPHGVGKCLAAVYLARQENSFGALAAAAAAQPSNVVSISSAASVVMPDNHASRVRSQGGAASVARSGMFGSSSLPPSTGRLPEPDNQVRQTSPKH